MKTKNITVNIDDVKNGKLETHIESAKKEGNDMLTIEVDGKKRKTSIEIDLKYNHVHLK